MHKRISLFALVAFLAGCGGSSPKVAGKVVEKHIEQKSVTYIKSGSLILPTGGGAKYVLVVGGPEGGAVAVSARVWANTDVGADWPPS